MYAIVEIAGQQFKVAKDQKVFVHRLEAKAGTKVSFDQVLLLSDGDKISLGAPAIANASVEAKVVKHLKDDKIIVFKKKRRKGYRVKNGHRQSLTEIIIESIGTSSEKEAVTTDEKPKISKTPATKKKEVTSKPEATSSNDLSKKTVLELKELAKEKGIQGISSMKKMDLIAALSA